MKISFIETELPEQEYFAAAFSEEEIEFVRTAEEVSAETEAVCVFIYSQIDDAFLAAHPSLRVVATRSTAVDHIDTAACARRGIAVRCVPSYGEHTVAEHTFALLLALARRLREVLHGARGHFSYESFRGFELRGKTLGIVGMGRIGQKVIPIARAFGMEVIVSEPRLTPLLAQAMGVRGVPLEELLQSSDVISLHAPLTPETHHMLNRDSLAQCRRGVIIINTARGPLIDTAALTEALDSGQVGGVGLDVLEDERVLREPAGKIVSKDIVNRMHDGFRSREARDPRRIAELAELMRSDAMLERPNVIFTPHVAFNSAEAIERINRTTVDNIREFILRGGSPPAAGACAQAERTSG